MRSPVADAEIDAYDTPLSVPQRAPGSATEFGSLSGDEAESALSFMTEVGKMLTVLRRKLQGRE